MPLEIDPRVLPPYFLPGKEPLPPGFSEDDRAMMMEQQKMNRTMERVQESCAVKTVLAGVGGACPLLPPRILPSSSRRDFPLSQFPMLSKQLLKNLRYGNRHVLLHAVNGLRV